MTQNSKIKLLPPEIYNRIAAGEVIERPANVAKELIENSIDAQSSEIVIEIVSSGKKLIRVTDNGIGMNKEELELAIQPHATSKISSYEDIYNLSTLGFRGEALSSIVSVSKTRIVSKPEGADTGYEIIVHGGEIVSIKPSAANKGTSTEVKDLFYNTPARLKFLKSDYTEKIHIIRTVEEYCISYKNIGFKLFVDGNLSFCASPTQNYSKRLEDILGKDVVKHLLFFEETKDKIKLTGFISPIDFTQVNKSLQMFFVNNRPITSRTISQALYDAYRDSLPTGRHPIGIIFIFLPPQEIDVNVHPTKRVIKFKQETEIYELIKNTIRTRFKTDVIKQTGFVPQQQIKLEQPTPIKLQAQNQKLDLGLTENSYLTFQPKLQENKYEKIGFNEYVYLGQLRKTYLLLETNKGLTIIDQHASSERILYEKFLSSEHLAVQKLLLPFNIELKPSDFEIIKPYIEEINKLSFEITVTGKNSIGIYGIPAILEIEDVKDFITKFIENLLSEFKETTKNVEPKERIVRSACRAAIKANDTMTLKDVDVLISDLSKCEQPFTCPHGRPTILNIDITQLEKMFLRRK